MTKKAWKNRTILQKLRLNLEQENPLKRLREIEKFDCVCPWSGQII